MGLRKLTDKPASTIDAKPAARLEREAVEAAEAVVRRYQTDAERSSVSTNREETDLHLDALSPSVGTDLQTPPPSHEEFKTTVSDIVITSRPAAPAPLPAPASVPAPTLEAKPAAVNSNSVDSFMASLEALRATLRQTIPAVPRSDSKPDTVSVATPVVKEAPVAKEPPIVKDTPPSKPSMEIPPIAMEEAALPEPIAPETASASALERMPLPPPVENPAVTPRPLYTDPLAKPRKAAHAPKPVAQREAPTLDNGMRAVRDAMPGLNLTPPKSDTPTNGRERPLSDGIPKSVSEDLPKYTARPKMRICGRCGHETKLRDAKCEKCSHVDESLGILDAVIAGDLLRTEQVLLVRPHLITLRTSRHDWTLLHMAASGGNPKMVELLIAKGASVNSANRDGKTALHYAAAKGHLVIVQTLLSHHADPTMLYSGKSPLDLARKAGHSEVAEAIRQLMPETPPAPLED